jgi:hypothetical protein
MALEKTLAVCVEFCDAFVVDWYAEESDEVANETCSCHSSTSFSAKRLHGMASYFTPSFPQHSITAYQDPSVRAVIGVWGMPAVMYHIQLGLSE